MNSCVGQLNSEGLHKIFINDAVAATDGNEEKVLKSNNIGILNIIFRSQACDTVWE